MDNIDGSTGIGKWLKTVEDIINFVRIHCRQIYLATETDNDEIFVTSDWGEGDGAVVTLWHGEQQISMDLGLIPKPPS